MGDKGRGLLYFLLVIAAVAVIVFTARAAGADRHCNVDAPDIHTWRLTEYVVWYDTECAKRDRLFVNNEWKETRTNKWGYKVYRSEFPIKYVRIVAVSDNGKSLKIYKR